MAAARSLPLASGRCSYPLCHIVLVQNLWTKSGQISALPAGEWSSSLCRSTLLLLFLGQLAAPSLWAALSKLDDEKDRNWGPKGAGKERPEQSGCTWAPVFFWRLSRVIN